MTTDRELHDSTRKDEIENLANEFLCFIYYVNLFRMNKQMNISRKVEIIVLNISGQPEICPNRIAK